MSRLLRSNFSRLKKDKIFWCAVMIMAGYCIFIALMFYRSLLTYGGNITFDTLFFQGFGLSGFALPGLIMAAVLSLFIGVEYSDGTIRNKLIVGHTRPQIYLANFITSAAIGIFLNIAYMITTCIIGLPLFGMPTLPVSTLVLFAADGIFMMISYAALFTMTTLLLSNKTSAAILNILAVIVFMFVCIYLINMIAQPEMLDTIEIVNGQQVPKTVPNPHYLSESARNAAQFFIDLLPSGQSTHLSLQSPVHPKLMILYSAVIICISSTIGVFFFGKKDIK